MRSRRWVAALTAIYAVLWLGGVVSHWLWRKTPEGAGWTAPAFLACAAALVLLAEPDARRWLAGVGLAGFLVELLGSKTGIPFGPYSYTPVLQPQLAGVPVAMFCAWVILIAYVKALLARIGWTGGGAIAAGAAWMTAIDLTIDPVATAALDFWRWSSSGPYYAIPLSNFAGWFLVSAVLLASGGRANVAGPTTVRVGRSVVMFFGFLAAAHRLWLASGVAFALVVLEAALGRGPRPQWGQASVGGSGSPAS